MNIEHATCPIGPYRLESPAGLRAEINANGSLRRMDHGNVIVNLFLGNEVEGGVTNLYLRRYGERLEVIPLLGPRSPGRLVVGSEGMAVLGEWCGIRFCVRLRLAHAAPAWYWLVDLENSGAEVEVDLIHVQDLALADYAAVRLNEYYVSQYLDHLPLHHPRRGWVVASRQNQLMGGRNPWCLIGSLGQGVSFATDALQVYGLAARAGETPAGLLAGLPGIRLQHEHAAAAIQDQPLRLAPGQRAQRGFFGWLVADHPEPSSDTDLLFVAEALAQPEARTPFGIPAALPQTAAPANLFSTAAPLPVLELSEAEIVGLFGNGRRHEERDPEGRLLSFFAGERRHVVLAAKERMTLRPHGQILRTGHGLTPDEAGLTSTVWMAGVFHSMVTQGHVSINRFLSTMHGYLGLFRSQGQRIFVQLQSGWRLLDLPSAFEMCPEGCRWIYRHTEGLLEVRAGALTERHELCLEVNVLSGNPVSFLISQHVAINGDDGANVVPLRWESQPPSVLIRAVPDSDVGRRFPGGGFRIAPRQGTTVTRVGSDELLFADGRSRQQPFLCFITAPALSVGFRLFGDLLPQPPSSLNPERPGDHWQRLTAGLRLEPPASSPLVEPLRQVADILPWFIQNALVHYLSPRGLEQYSGGGWGTRDVTQGPVELLLGIGRPEPVRDILLRVFRNQNPDGDWPQWFMFFERERSIRPNDSHGDIVFWPLLALGQYLLATEDAALLDEPVPYFRLEGEAPSVSIWEHVRQALRLIESRLIPGTRLASYGHGDWNDSLQPVDPRFRDRLCSAWTVTLHYQTLVTLAAALEVLDRPALAAPLADEACRVLADFRRLLIADGVVTGYAHFEETGGEPRLLLHPRDRDTGLSYSLLPMIHAIINGMLEPADAQHQLALIRAHLLGPDGARLFDRPMAYRGGPQRIFQRAESSSFFGREIGLMYTHAHLRYAEALWHVGDAEGLFAALAQAIPIRLRERVATARSRQANCYHSSSDAVFQDRYEAERDYGKVLAGEIDFEGGWRVYSSGAGIATGLIFRCLLGLRQEGRWIVLDPVLPRALDGLRASLGLAGLQVEVTYHIAAQGCGLTRLEVDGATLPISRRPNPYRLGAASIELATLRERADAGKIRLTAHLA